MAAPVPVVPVKQPAWDPIIERLQAKMSAVRVLPDGWVLVTAFGYGEMHVRPDHWDRFAAAMPQMARPVAELQNDTRKAG